jgi:hypothetical protein
VELTLRLLKSVNPHPTVADRLRAILKTIILSVAEYSSTLQMEDVE